MVLLSGVGNYDRAGKNIYTDKMFIRTTYLH